MEIKTCAKAKAGTAEEAEAVPAELLAEGRDGPGLTITGQLCS